MLIKAVVPAPQSVHHPLLLQSPIGWSLRRSSPSTALIGQTARRAWRLIAANIIFSLLQVLGDGGTLWIVFLVVQLMTTGEVHWSTRLPQGLRLWLEALPFWQVLVALLAAALGLQLLLSISRYATTLTSGYFTARCRRRVLDRLHGQIMALSFPCVSRYRIGDLSDVIQQAPAGIQAVIDQSSQSLVNVLMAAGYMVVLLCISPWLLLLALGIGAALTAMQRLALPRLRSAAGQVMRSQVDIVTAMTDDLMGLRLLHSYGQLDQAQGALERRTATLEAGLRRRARLINLIPPISSLLPLVCITILVAVSVVLFKNRSTGVMPSLITFVLGLQRLNVRLTSLATSVSVVVDNLPTLARIDGILTADDKQFVRRGGVAFASLADAIRFDGVGLTYPSCEEQVLHDLSFSMPKGSTTALVGSSGAGKSSIADLLIGLYAPTQGSIFIDGVDLQHIDPQSWQQRLGVVNQDSFLFNRSIADNIAFGSPGASHEAILRAATMAHADGFIRQLPDGFETRVGERGFRLSGGQRQRIALARALLRQPQLLILDEATSALDTENEFLVQEALRDLDHSFTRLVIAHRLATVVDADQILVIDRGRIVQRGTHTQLSLEESGTYRQLLLRQALSDRSLQPG